VRRTIVSQVVVIISAQQVLSRMVGTEFVGDRFHWFSTNSVRTMIISRGRV
jgi:hypothetical protein